MAGIIPAAGSVSSGNSKFRRRRYTPIADINVTPLVDVMLVLLIIFMVTAPLLQVGVPVDLPKTSAQQVGGKDEPLVVSVNAEGVYLGETKYDLPELGSKLKAVHDEKPDQRVFIRGDKAIDYGKMMEVMGVVIDSGFRQLGLLGEAAQQLGKGGGGTVTPAPGPAPAAPRGQQPQPQAPRR